MSFELKYCVQDAVGTKVIDADNEPQALEQLIEWLGPLFVYSDILGIKEIQA